VRYFDFRSILRAQPLQWLSILFNTFVGVSQKSATNVMWIYALPFEHICTKKMSILISNNFDFLAYFRVKNFTQILCVSASHMRVFVNVFTFGFIMQIFNNVEIKYILEFSIILDNKSPGGFHCWMISLILCFMYCFYYICVMSVIFFTYCVAKYRLYIFQINKKKNNKS